MGDFMNLARPTAALLTFAVASCSPDHPSPDPGRSVSALKLPVVDILVFAPHSDDEAIGCTGVMLQALERKQRVGVVIITAGDAHEKAAAVVAGKSQEQLVHEDFLRLADLRQRHTQMGTSRIGVPFQNVWFLGYPDGGLARIYEMDAETAYRHPLTHQRETYGRVARDYHSQVHGGPAPYTKSSVISDLAEIIKSCQPQEIYVTHEVDTHADHRASFWFVRDAAASAGYKGTLFTYVVHGRPPQEPPGRRVTLSASQFATKRAVIELYQQGTSPVHDQLADTYALPEELFWPTPIESAPAK